MKNVLVFVFAICSVRITLGQGKLLIVGGGSEAYLSGGALQAGSWSDTAYRWAIQQSANKRVAVISTSSATNDLPNYFKNLGAVDAINITISSRSQVGMYDSLMNFDFIFFRGGDQSLYYQYFKDTAVMRACIDKFAQGGVLGGTSAGMHILSSVVYTANHSGSLLSDEALENPNSSRINAGLADDFFNTFPNYIFDTHFSERGRFPRLIAMMGNWEKIKNKYPVMGIGMSDQNAMCIAGNIGVSWGTATTQIFGFGKNHRINNFPQYGSSHRSLAFDSMNVISLVNGDTIDFTTFQVRSAPGKKMQTVPRVPFESGNYTVYLSGANDIISNAELFDSLANGIGAPPKNKLVLIITGTSTTNANSVRTNLQTRGFTNVVVQQAITSNTDTANFRTQILNAHTFVFVGNTLSQLSSFMSTSLGNLLSNAIKSDGVTNVFIGENSHYAGATTAPDEIHTNYSLSYNGNFTYVKGLGVLQTSGIIARAFDYDLYTSSTNNAWENQANIIPFIMTKDSLRFGIWLNEGTFLKYDVRNDTTFFSSFGRVPAIVLENKGTHFEEVSRRFSSTSTRIRDLVGFGSMQMRYLDRTSGKLPVGILIPRANFILSATNVGVGDTVAFTNVSRSASNFAWYINHQLISNQRNAGVRFTNPGNYSVKLVASTLNGSDSIARTLTVSPPTASFSVSADTINAGDSVTFVNTSSFASSYVWLFGGADSVQSLNAGKRFSTPGNYTVRLVARAGIFADTALRQIHVRPPLLVEDSFDSKLMVKNPVQEVLSVSGIQQPVALFLYDLTGNLLLQQNASSDTVIPCYHLPKGIYLLKVITSGQAVTLKILKE